MSAAKLRGWYCQISVVPFANVPFTINDGFSIEIPQYYASIFARPPALTAPAGLHNAKHRRGTKTGGKNASKPIARSGFAAIGLPLSSSRLLPLCDDKVLLKNMPKMSLVKTQ